MPAEAVMRVPIALKRGHSAYDECFGYVPLLCPGRPKSADWLKKVKSLEHIGLILAIGGHVCRFGRFFFTHMSIDVLL